MAYERVNGAWPAEVPPVTSQEAISASRRLWRRFMGRPFAGKIKLDRKLRGRSVILAVDPDRRFAMYINIKHGWRGLIHIMSHRVHERLHPGPSFKEHDFRHHWIEKEMVEYVVASGWLDGKLRREPKEPKVVDVKLVRRARAEARLEAWKRKRKRADAAIRKIERTVRYYERQMSA